MAKSTINKEEVRETVEQKIKKCGIIMPISPHPDYLVDHWKDVLNILSEAISDTEFSSNLVSDDEAIGLIHERIVTNIYNSEIIVCDVSSKNPNVMFELGLRLAFDKPVIIIKDDKTSYSFDTGVIEHISYPSSLRFGEIVAFKKELARKIEATYKKSIQENFSPFLKGFGKTIVPAKIGNEEISETKFLVEQIYKLRDDMKRIRFDIRNQSVPIYEDRKIDATIRSLVSKYFYDIISEKGRVSIDDLLEHTITKFKEVYPECQCEKLEGLLQT